MARALAPLREELRLHEGGCDRDGAPFWLIHDPPANRWFRIGWLEFEFLSRWGSPPEEMIAGVEADTALRPTGEDLARTWHFLQQNRLLRDDSPGAAATLAEAAGPPPSLSSWLVHNYLFFRIPLLRPDRFLDAAYPFVRPLLSRAFLGLLLLCGAAGIYLASRQWDAFAASLLDTLNPSGLAGYFLAMVAAKLLHEAGHGIAAKHFGVRVPRMGIAFLVLWPVLYTDTNGSWLLKESRSRFLVAAGGILAEGAVAAISLLLWGLLGDGPLRQTMHFLAVVSLSRTLLVNVSPFMRFDGYYLLSDLLDLPNLQERAFALARHDFRRRLFGLESPPPEEFPPPMRRFLKAYAVATWLYRMVVCLGIAFAVYHLFFKPLGIALMMVELWYFVLRPIVRETSDWRKVAPMVSPARKALFAVLAAGAFALPFLPLGSKVVAPALLAAERQRLYAPFPARLVTVPEAGRTVRKGDLLFRLEAEEARFGALQSEREAEAIRGHAVRLMASEAGRAEAPSRNAAAQEREQAATGHRAELRRLEIRAEMDGTLVDLDEGIRPGVDVSPRDLLGVVVRPGSGEIEAYVPEGDLSRIRPGERAEFRPDAPGAPVVAGTVASIEGSRLAALPSVALAERHGGKVATAAGREGQLAPAGSVYRVRIRPDRPLDVARMETGEAVLRGRGVSPAARLLRQAMSVLVRESGF